ncbi:MAG: 2-oxoglutarate ferredoxin oxidoreductase subunit delta [Synergistales bacterium]|nr:2-oxoglutarate ferredoxin oxidoreductase subunit delta [Synergistales bacterium]HAG22388.1 tungsten formylmethanofuran dehydrogenase [Synergistaceae bacterium]
MAKGRIDVLESFCKSCGLCVEACPVKVLRISDKINSKGYRPVEQYKDGCIACRMCATTCPDAAIEVYKIEENS